MAYRNNPIVQQKIFLARQKKAQQINSTKVIWFRAGIKAGAKAAKELISEGFNDSPDFESLVFERVKKHRRGGTE
ncbi:MAG TPA: hypothetical protein VMA13_00615 [Candidatus Saccharimonadales bacterium]|nr:hypothetical protein [Candidatus Saccharimonadales bacterium]